ncbi:MAG: MATE family efflux transporter, partial [Bacteroidales bacterium]|nr:MATE family efflux transporter [Bacteroidales bacterium]
MDRALNREILRLSIPSILANLTVPLVGFVDTAVAGHLPQGEIAGAGIAGAAAFIGAISVGAMLFNLLYWSFGFLRTGTGGLTAQAFGRGDMADAGRILCRGLVLSLGIAAVALLLQWPFVKAVLFFVQASPEVEALAEQYFFIRIWAAPATLSLMAFSGWFVGMQDSMSSMWKDFVVNGVNVAASFILALGVGSWEGLGFRGIAWGTVVAQYAGLLFCVAVCAVKYRKKVFDGAGGLSLVALFRGERMRSFFRMNTDLFVRSVFFISIYIGFTAISARFGDMMLACGALMMQLLMIFSFFTDGFAYAGEALSGRFIGAGDGPMLRRTVRYTFAWSMALGVVFIFLYHILGMPAVRLMTSDVAVAESCRQFLPWLSLMPPFGCSAFTWDGIYLGAT